MNNKQTTTSKQQQANKAKLSTATMTANTICRRLQDEGEKLQECFLSFVDLCQPSGLGFSVREAAEDQSGGLYQYPGVTVFKEAKNLLSAKKEKIR